MKVFVETGVDEITLEEWRKKVTKIVEEWEDFGRMITENSCPGGMLEDLESLNNKF